MKPLHSRLIGRHHPRALVAAVAVASALASGGCGDVRAVDRAGSASTSDAAQVPAAVVEVLLRGEIEVADASFDGGMSAPEAVAAFDELYQSVPSDAAATAYAVTVASSQESRLPPGTDVRMVHVPHVKQDGSPPVLPDHSEPSSTIIDTDMFAFFGAETGDHLATVYIGPGEDPGTPPTEWSSGNLTITTERSDNAGPPIPA